MKKITEFLDLIRSDYKAHLIIGLISGFPMVLFFGNIGGLIAIIIYTLKEVVYDKLLNRGNMELLDWIYSSIPVLFYLIIHNK